MGRCLPGGSTHPERLPEPGKLHRLTGSACPSSPCLPQRRLLAASPPSASPKSGIGKSPASSGAEARAGIVCGPQITTRGRRRPPATSPQPLGALLRAPTGPPGPGPCVEAPGAGEGGGAAALRLSRPRGAARGSPRGPGPAAGTCPRLPPWGTGTGTGAAGSRGLAGRAGPGGAAARCPAPWAARARAPSGASLAARRGGAASAPKQGPGPGPGAARSPGEQLEHGAAAAARRLLCWP